VILFSIIFSFFGISRTNSRVEKRIADDEKRSLKDDLMDGEGRDQWIEKLQDENLPVLSKQS
jgi:hypothetical protein